MCRQRQVLWKGAAGASFTSPACPYLVAAPSTGLGFYCVHLGRLNVCAVAESSADWHLCSVPLHSKVQFVSKFLMFFCMAGLETLSVDGELSVDIRSSHHMFMGERDMQKIKIK